MRNIYRLGLIAASVATALSMSASLHAAPKHNKEVIGYLTTWEAWKGPEAGFSVTGEATHLNIDMDIYSILNFSFFGVAKDGSLHSGDLRNKNIYQEGAEQEPGALVHPDVYSSWDFHLLWGELEYIHEFPGNEPWQAEQLVKVKKQGFVKDGQGWKHVPSDLKGQMPIPLKKEGGAPGLIDLANEKGVKVMASIGGWSMSKHFPEMASNPQMKERFLKDVDRLMALGFHGIDIDWEFPGTSSMNFTGSEEDYPNFEQLMEDIRARIGSEKLLTAAFKAVPSALEGYDWDRLSKSMDYFNMMTYDLNGGWSDITGHNSPLYAYPEEEFKGLTLDDLRVWMQARGIPSEKINFGAAFYGRGMQTKETTAYLGAPTDKRMLDFSVDGPTLSSADVDNWKAFDGQPNFNFIVKTPGWTHFWDNKAKVPYAIKGKYFLSYDDEKAIRNKAQYVVDHGLGGIIVWQAHGDIRCDGQFISYGPKLKQCTDLRSPLAEQIDAVFSKKTAPNTGPVLTVPGHQSVDSGKEITFFVSASDVDGDTLSFSSDDAKIIPTGNGEAKVIFSAPKTEKDMKRFVTVKVSDGMIARIKTVLMDIKGAGIVENTAPELSAPSFVTVTAGNEVLIIVSAIDAQSDALVFTSSKGEVTQNGNEAVITFMAPHSTTDSVIPVVVRVTDGSKADVTTVSVKVEGVKVPAGDIWDAIKIYNSGDTVTHNGVKYTAQWWTKGDLPGEQDVWLEVDDGTVKPWNEGKVYNAGDTVSYNGETYTAKWWTKGDAPNGSNSPWEIN